MRPWYLEDRARHYRQNLLLSSFACAELNAIFHRHCRSHAGKARLHMDPPGVLGKLAASVQQASPSFFSLSISISPELSPSCCLFHPVRRFLFFVSRHVNSSPVFPRCLYFDLLLKLIVGLERRL